MRYFSLGRLAGLALACLLLANLSVMGQAAGGNAAGKTMKNPVPANAQSLAAGQAIFQKTCSVCHGASGQGDGSIVKSLKADAVKPANLTDAKWDHGSTDGEIYLAIRDGLGGPQGMMKPQKDKIKDADLWNIVNYVRSLGPKGK